MKIAVDLDDTLSVVDRVTQAQEYIGRTGLPFKLKNRNAHSIVDVFDWELADVLRFVRSGGFTVFTEAKPRGGARDSLLAFKEAGHTVTVLTARTKEWFSDPAQLSRDWLEKHRIPYDDIVAEVTEKGAWCAERGYGALIDDSLGTCLSAQAQGVNAILVVDESNRDRAAEVRYRGETWKEIERAVESITFAKKQV